MNGTENMTERKSAIRELTDRTAPMFERWRELNHYFHDEDERYTRFLATAHNERVLDLGCGNGDLLAALSPERGIGVDFSEKAIEFTSSLTILCSTGRRLIPS